VACIYCAENSGDFVLNWQSTTHRPQDNGEQGKLKTQHSGFTWKNCSYASYKFSRLHTSAFHYSAGPDWVCH